MNCGSDSAVIDTRRAKFEGRPALMRRRKCKACGERWSTREIAVSDLEGLRTLAAAARELIKAVKVLAE